MQGGGVKLVTENCLAAIPKIGTDSKYFFFLQIKVETSTSISIQIWTAIRVKRCPIQEKTLERSWRGRPYMTSHVCEFFSILISLQGFVVCVILLQNYRPLSFNGYCHQ